MTRPTALVTGGAVRLGAAIARRLAAGGFRVLVHARGHAEAALALAAELGGHALTADLGAPGGADALADATLAQLDGAPLTVLVNNAASFLRGPSEALPLEDFEAQLRLNLTAPFRLCQRLAPALRAGARPGAIVNLLDVSALRPYGGAAAYSATKAGLQALTVGLAAEWGPQIRVNGVAPGAALFPADEDADARARHLSRTPHGRESGAESIAEAVWFLVDGPAAVTGTVLTVDGGRSARW